MSGPILKHLLDWFNPTEGIYYLKTISEVSVRLYWGPGRGDDGR